MSTIPEVLKRVVPLSLSATLALDACGSANSAALTASTIPSSPPGISTPDARPSETAVILTSIPTLEPVTTPTLASSPTSIPPTSTPEATPTPKIEKSPLPIYGVFTASFTNEKGAPGAIMVASIPQANNADIVLIYYVQGRQDGKGAENSYLYGFNVQKTDGNNFEISPPGGRYHLQATLDQTGKGLSGAFIQKSYTRGRAPFEPSGPPITVLGINQKFQATFKGTGRGTVWDSMKEVKMIGYEARNTSLTQINISSELSQLQAYHEGRDQKLQLPE